MIELRPIQIKVISEAIPILINRGIVYLAMEMRTGKTITSLTIASRLGEGKTLFVTKKLAIEGITNDINALKLSDKVTIINYESLHKIKEEFDTVICDESSCIGAYPVPSEKTKILRNIKRNYTILMSGTPHPESASQLYHQFWTKKDFWKQHTNFYSFAKEFVKVKKQKVSYNREINNYDDCDYDKLMIWLNPLIVRATQEEAGFESNFNIKEHRLPTPDNIKNIIKILRKDKIVRGKDGIILADTPVKMMQKEHQIISGTCLLEEGDGVVLSTYKVDYIKANFKNAVIFYKYKKELELLESANLENCKLLQISAGSMGLTLTEYDSIVYFNLDFSCVNWLQSRERINFKGRDSNNIHVILSESGIDNDILKTLNKKEDYSIKIYKF